MNLYTQQEEGVKAPVILQTRYSNLRTYVDMCILCLYIFLTRKLVYRNM